MNMTQFAKFQFVELLCSNDTERVRAVTKRTVPGTNCLRWITAKFQFTEKITAASFVGAAVACLVRCGSKPPALQH